MFYRKYLGLSYYTSCSLSLSPLQQVMVAVMDCNMELKVLSCTDVKAFNYFRRLALYVVANIIKHELKNNQQHIESQTQRTPIHKDSDTESRHEWNHTMNFNLKTIALEEDGESNYLLRFKLRIGGVKFGNRIIGKVCVPLKDLIEEFNGDVRYPSYQIQGTDGKSNGVLNFSYKLNRETTHVPKAVPSSEFDFPRDRKLENYPTQDVENQLREMGCSVLPRISVAASSASPFYSPTPISQLRLVHNAMRGTYCYGYAVEGRQSMDGHGCSLKQRTELGQD